MSTTTTPQTTPWPVVKRRGAARLRLTDRDRALLEFVAAHRFVHGAHLREWLGAGRTVSYRRPSLLVEAGLLRYERIFHAQPGVFTITHGGLAVIGSDLPRPTVDLSLYRHESAVPVLWLAARAGVFGRPSAIWTERQIVHHDQTLAADELPPLGVSLGSIDRAGRERRHNPDVLIASSTGGRIALELELSLKARRRLEGIMLACQRDETVERVFYFTDQRQVHHAVGTVASLLAPRKVEVIRVAMPLTTDTLADAVRRAGEGRR